MAWHGMSLAFVLEGHGALCVLQAGARGRVPWPRRGARDGAPGGRDPQADGGRGPRLALRVQPRPPAVRHLRRPREGRLRAHAPEPRREALPTELLPGRGAAAAQRPLQGGAPLPHAQPAAELQLPGLREGERPAALEPLRLATAGKEKEKASSTSYIYKAPSPACPGTNWYRNYDIVK